MVMFYKKKKKSGDAVEEKAQVTKKAKKAPVADSDEDEEGDSENEEKDSGDEGEDGEDGKDGMADMMSKILNQKVKSNVPVLEKRNTTIMKQIGVERKEQQQLKKAQAERRHTREKQIAKPGDANILHEKTLRKLATKGVIALFNAVAESQRVDAQMEDDSSDKKKEKSPAEVGVSRVDIKKMSKSNFLDLLTGAGSSSGAKSTPKDEDDDEEDDDREDDLADSAGSGSEEEGEEGEEEEEEEEEESDDGAAPGWSALQDNFLGESSTHLKDFDKDSDSEGPDFGSGSDEDDLLDEAKLKRISKDSKNTKTNAAPAGKRKRK